MTRVIALCTLLLASASLNAQQFPDWLLERIREDTETPETLPWHLGVGAKCPYNAVDLAPVVENAIVRSRIKAIGTFDTQADFFLEALLECIDGTPFVYVSSVYFGRRIGYWIASDFGSFGTTNNPQLSDLERVLKEGVERAMTAYLKANFDL